MNSAQIGSMNRTGHILNSKLRKYLIPTIATALAMSLDEFVDSIIVANLLDLKAMTVISVASPIVLVVAAIYMLFGVGGSTLYAVNIGSRNTKAAGKAFSVSLLTALFTVITLCVLGTLFSESFCRFLCADESLYKDLLHYVRILLLTAPFIVGIQTLSGFLPAAGAPNIATLICIIANVTNLIFDYIYIRFFDMGVGGTAYATLTGYGICLVLLVVMLLCRKIKLHVTMPSWKDFRSLREIVLQGGANAIGQLGYTIKFTFYNQFILSLVGTVGLGAFAVAKQLLSIMSIGLAGISEAVAPFLSTLKGQKDTSGIKYVLRSGIIYVTAISTALVVLFECFPELLYKMFNVTDKAVTDMATGGIRIFLLMFLVRGAYIVYMSYARISGHKGYAMLISMLDGFALLLPVALLCSYLFGMTGIWLSFPVTCVMIFLGIIIYNRILVRRSNGRLEGLFLLEHEDDVKVCEMTIGEEDESISGLSEELTAFCTENGIEKSTAARIGLIAEEMAVYTRRHRKKSDRIDIITRISEEHIRVDFRSEGTPFNPLAKSDEDDEGNFLLINKLPSKISYDYILGMNSTQFIIDKI